MARPKKNAATDAPQQQNGLQAGTSSGKASPAISGASKGQASPDEMRRHFSVLKVAIANVEDAYGSSSGTAKGGAKRDPAKGGTKGGAQSAAAP